MVRADLLDAGVKQTQAANPPYLRCFGGASLSALLPWTPSVSLVTAKSRCHIREGSSNCDFHDSHSFLHPYPHEFSGGNANVSPLPAPLFSNQRSSFLTNPRRRWTGPFWARLSTSCGSTEGPGPFLHLHQPRPVRHQGHFRLRHRHEKRKDCRGGRDKRHLQPAFG